MGEEGEERKKKNDEKGFNVEGRRRKKGDEEEYKEVFGGRVFEVGEEEIEKPREKSVERNKGFKRNIEGLDGGEIEKIEEGTEKSGEDFSRGVESNGERGFGRGDFFEQRREFFRSDEEVIFYEEVDT